MGFNEYLKEELGEEEPMELSLAQHLGDKPKERNYQKIAESNIKKLERAMVAARDAAEMLGIAIKKGAKVEGLEEITKKISNRSRWMIEDILGTGK